MEAVEVCVGTELLALLLLLFVAMTERFRPSPVAGGMMTAGLQVTVGLLHVREGPETVLLHRSLAGHGTYDRESASHPLEMVS